MPTNQLLPFGMGESPNRISFDDWNALPARLTGFQSGIASSQQFNYILAQGGIAGYIIGQLIVEQIAQDATLADADTLFTNFKAAVAKFIPGAIADKSIVTAKLADLAVTTAKLANLGVTSEKIADNAVITAKIYDLAITTAKIAAGAVTNDKIAAGTIAFDRLATATIATEEQAIAGTAKTVLMTPFLVAKAIAALIPPAMPTGMIFPWPGDTPPEGAIVADGRELSRTTYAGLFSIFGTTYGAGDGSTTFNVPDLDGRFIELTTDAGSVGQFVEPGLPNITGYFGRLTGTRGVDEGTFSGAFALNGASNLSHGGQDSATNARNSDFDASRCSVIYGETETVQPFALRGLACIKI